MLDTEIKREVIKVHQGHSLSKPGHKLSNNEKKLLQEVLMHSGNFEIQKQNTGVGGNKVIRDLPLIFKPIQLSYKERVGDNFIWKKIQGLSSIV
ncbi:inositol phosphate phosphatase SopB [Providencia burhodogranariea DSM 19968]|uniref:Inositol phosphate phosphatase SopB n=2 Tax=Providencia burhodogranariea TaxID=516074 RepID=K8WMB1_9GAMM|nr:inositol phosphate phosphatase SopB [Providencia burhodogranariea DSM 19968]